jgi:riboflavin-specific deaminase-like protein
VSSPGAGRIEAAVLSVLRECSAEARPAVTLSWARTSAGAIAAADGSRTAVSGSESLVLTHRLRAMHGAILVGIQTVLSDDPLLSVRLVDGPQPRPLVLDSRLRLPAGARLLSRADTVPWIFHAEGTGGERGDAGNAAEELQRAGARLFPVPGGSQGLDLAAVLAVIRSEGIASVMVEGGARVLQSFIASALAAQAVITTSPSVMEGIPGPEIPRFAATREDRYGSDTVLWGRFPPR